MMRPMMRRAMLLSGVGLLLSFWAAGGGCSATGGGTTGTGGAGGDTGPLPGALGAPCTTDADCDDHLCVSVNGGQHICSKTCGSASDCAPSWTCDAEPGVGSACKCTPSGSEACDNVDNDCDGVVDEKAACPTGNVCIEGQCTCPPEHVCNGVCTDPDTDSLNCGGCGNVCGPGTKCESGSCGCTMPCGSGCPDMLTDPQNCGACGHTCAAGCSNGHCLPVTLLSNTIVGDLRIAGGDLYAVTATGTGASLLRFVGGGGNPQTIVSNADQIFDFSVNDTFVFWVDTPSVSGNPVYYKPKTGGSTGMLVEAPELAYVAATSSQLYFSYSDASTYIVRAPLSGGNAVELLTAPAYVEQILVDGSDYFWTAANKIWKGTAQVAKNLVGPTLVGFDSGYVYFEDGYSNGAFSGLYRVPKSGGTVESLATGIASSAAAVDGADVYWTDRKGGTLYKVPVAGGAPVTVATGLDSPSRIAVDGQHIFFSLSNSIVQLDK